MGDSQWILSYKSSLTQYTEEQLRYQASPEIWSLGQMYDHLILTALDYLDQAGLCKAAAADPTLGKTETGERIFEGRMFPPVKIKLPDGPENSPSNIESKEDLARGLDRVQERMSEWTGKLEEIDPHRKIQHGGFGWLNAKEWFALIDMHFRHHLQQQRELEARLPINERAVR
ncbi:DinB family protein [Paenibacillus silviterrae]|uniref:DinB family protein n=1 Tax=Paenibacillus silviterrae TaxID=3242194 RepID=UPI002543734B|nr:DinB family protein [Paenibacillus chinjuensis]